MEYDLVMETLELVNTNNEITNTFVGNTLETTLVPGPVWNSFEKFRTSGSTALDSMPKASVATLRTKAATYRVMRDEDFQRLVGWASEACRIQKGVRLVVQAAKVVLKHPEKESFQLLIDSASMIAESPALPLKRGHDSLQLSQSEIDEQAKDEFNLENAEIPRPW